MRLKMLASVAFMAVAACLFMAAQNSITPGRYSFSQSPLFVHGRYTFWGLSSITCTETNSSGSISGNCVTYAQSSVVYIPNSVRIPSTATVSLEKLGDSTIAGANCHVGTTSGSNPVMVCDIMMGCGVFPNVEAGSVATNNGAGSPAELFYNSGCSGVTNLNQIQWLTQVGNSSDSPPFGATHNGYTTITGPVTVVW